MLTSEKLSDRGALKSPRPSADVIDPKSLGSDDVEAVGDGGVGSESRSASSCTPFAAIAARTRLLTDESQMRRMSRRRAVRVEARRELRCDRPDTLQSGASGKSRI